MANMTINGKTGDTFDIQTSVFQSDGTTVQNLTGATVTSEAVEVGGAVVPASTTVVSNAVGGIVDSFFNAGILGNGLWTFSVKVVLDGSTKIVKTEPILVDDLLPEAT